MQECSCGRNKSVVDFVKVSHTRTIIQCAECGGVVALIDNEPTVKDYPKGKARKYYPWVLDRLK